MSKIHVKKGDRVVVITGSADVRGKEGKVLNVNPKANKVVIEGVAMVTKHQKPRRQGEPGGTFQKERAIAASNVMLICPKCNKPTKVGRRVVEIEDENGKKKFKRVRVCRLKDCGRDIDE